MQLAKMRFGLLNECHGLCLALHVGTHEEGVGPGRFQLGGDVLTAFAIPVGKRHFGPFLDKQSNGRFSDARCASGNGGNFTV
jgi:hypothetical protein